MEKRRRENCEVARNKVLLLSFPPRRPEEVGWGSVTEWFLGVVGGYLPSYSHSWDTQKYQGSIWGYTE